MDFAKTILKAFKYWTEGELAKKQPLGNYALKEDIPEVDYPVTSVNGQTGDVVIDAAEQIQSDWNQSDEAAKDYIKNRTHYRTKLEKDIFLSSFEVTYDQTDNGRYTVDSNLVPQLQESSEYCFKIAGYGSYKVISESVGDGDEGWIIDFYIPEYVRIIWRSGYDNGESQSSPSLLMLLSTEDEYSSISLEIYEIQTTYSYEKLQAVYLPDETVTLNNISTPASSGNFVMSVITGEVGSPGLIQCQDLNYNSLKDIPFYDSHIKEKICFGVKMPTDKTETSFPVYESSFSGFSSSLVVKYNNKIYEDINYGTDDDTSPLGLSEFIGNPFLWSEEYEDNGLPFFARYSTEYFGEAGKATMYITCIDKGAELIVYEPINVELKTIDEKFLPEAVVLQEDIQNVLMTEQEIDTLLSKLSEGGELSE